MVIRENEPLAPLTTFKIGGVARYFVEVNEETELSEIFHFVRTHAMPVFVLGGGSNILVCDNGFSGLVVKMNTKNISWTEDGEELLLSVDAGLVWDDVVGLAVAHNGWGLENLSLIPGTVGGALVQNIGAYGVEVGALVHTVDVFDLSTGERKQLTRDDCRFGYRESYFKQEGKNFLITRATLRLTTRANPNIVYKDIAAHFGAHGNAAPTLADIRDAVVRIRMEKFPDLKRIGTAGSFFKNPVVATALANSFLEKFPSAPHFNVGNKLTKLSAAWIIDHVLQMRGVRAHNVGCWSEQALVIVNYGGASSDDVKKFSQEIQKKCFDETHITLVPEVISVDA